MNESIFYLYILKCSDQSYYIGHTDNIEKRLSEHHEGKASLYTVKRLPIELVYMEIFQTRSEAFVAERKLKKWTREKKETVIKYGWQALKQWKSKKRINPSTR